MGFAPRALQSALYWPFALGLLAGLLLRLRYRTAPATAVATVPV